MVVFGQVRVGDEAEGEVVVFVVHAGEPGFAGAQGGGGAGDRGVGGSGAAFGVQGGVGAVAFAGEGDPVVAVAGGDVEGRVHAAAEQVVVDEAVALGGEQA